MRSTRSAQQNQQHHQADSAWMRDTSFDDLIGESRRNMSGTSGGSALEVAMRSNSSTNNKNRFRMSWPSSLCKVHRQQRLATRDADAGQPRSKAEPCNSWHLQE